MNAEQRALSSTEKYQNVRCTVLKVASGKEDGRLVSKDQSCLFSSPLTLRSLREQPLLRALPSTMKQHPGCTKCSWAIRSAKTIQKRGKLWAPHSFRFLCHTHSSPFLHSTAVKGFGTGMKETDQTQGCGSGSGHRSISCTKAHKEGSRGSVTQAPDQVQLEQLWEWKRAIISQGH